jgi:hypothetical protein
MISPIRKGFVKGLALLFLAGGSTYAGGITNGITFTGDVEKDFTSGLATNPILDNNGNPGDVGQFSWMTSQNKITGWDLKDIRLAWDQQSDTLYVGMNYFGVAGDSDGNGVVGTYSQEFKNAGGLELPGLGGRSGITLGVGVNSSTGKPLVVAGIPNDKSQAGPGLNGFNVASAIPGGIMGSNYGATLTDNIGTLYSGGPDFEFTINNFSKLPGIDINNGIGLSFVSGSAIDSSIGEDSVPYYTIGKLSPIVVPEPTTILAWTLGVAAVGLYSRRRSHAGQ